MQDIFVYHWCHGNNQYLTPAMIANEIVVNHAMILVTSEMCDICSQHSSLKIIIFSILSNN